MRSTSGMRHNGFVLRFVAELDDMTQPGELVAGADDAFCAIDGVAARPDNREPP